MVWKPSVNAIRLGIGMVEGWSALKKLIWH